MNFRRNFNIPHGPIPQVSPIKTSSADHWCMLIVISPWPRVCNTGKLVCKTTSLQVHMTAVACRKAYQNEGNDECNMREYEGTILRGLEGASELKELKHQGFPVINGANDVAVGNWYPYNK